MSNRRSFHGADAFHRGINAPQSRFYDQGKFGRLFPNLPSLQVSRDALLALGAAGGPMDPGLQEKEDNYGVDAGWVFFGQFVDHDISLDTASSLEQQNDPEAIQNFRTPNLELDSVYGSGPDVNPHLYHDVAGEPTELLLDRGYPRDLPRNSEGTALIGDPRNDENVVISQLQLAFLKFHNIVVHDVAIFEEAQTIVRWHYQWLVLHEFLPRIVGRDVVEDVYHPGRPGEGRKFYNWRHQPYIPVEFSVAAYRYGHAQVPGRLKVNDEFQANGSHRIPLFDVAEIDDVDPDDLSGGRRAPRRYVDWRYLFDTGDGTEQSSKVITPQLASTLFNLPFFQEQGQIPSLAQRNLLRGHAFGLPSGQAVARAMCVEQLSADDLKELRQIEAGLDIATPLWYYILKEAEVFAYGERLGPVGARIVAEVLVGLMEGDRLSFVRADPTWKPVYGRYDGDFEMSDLFDVAGVLREQPEPAYGD